MADRPGGDDLHALLEEQKAYYQARAPEYDEWWDRRGSRDAGPAFHDWWEQQKACAYEAVLELDARGHVLELAAGTGNFTRSLVTTAEHVTALDASAETLAIAARKVAAVPGACSVDFVTADVFTWRPPRRYDTVFFSFWLSHVPAARFAEFWATVADALRPGGQVGFVDSGLGSDIPADGTTCERTLDDGRTFTIVKRSWEPAALAGELRELGWDADVRTSPGDVFLLGSAVRAG